MGVALQALGGGHDVVGLDSSIILPRETWVASGHVGTFTDPLIECLHCHKRFRMDHLQEALAERKGIDDPVGAISVHGVGGCLGVLFVGIFSDGRYGFGWNLNEVIGAQVVSVPMTVPLARADKTFSVFMISLTGIFLAVGIVLIYRTNRIINFAAAAIGAAPAILAAFLQIQ